MQLKTLVLVIAAAHAAARIAFPPAVTINGTTTDCFADSIIRIPSVRISAFNASVSREMIDSLRAMESLSFEDNPSASIARMNVQFDRVMALAGKTAPLAQAETNAYGGFEISTQPVDSILILATYDDEGEAFPYAYSVVAGRSNHSIELDLSRGSCSYIKERNF
jgi:hypothetical protein